MLVLLPTATVLTLMLTILIRKNALQKNQLDIPNERSSHTAPTPRGAGVAVGSKTSITFDPQTKPRLSQFLLPN